MSNTVKYEKMAKSMGCAMELFNAFMPCKNKEKFIVILKDKVIVLNRTVNILESILHDINNPVPDEVIVELHKLGFKRTPNSLDSSWRFTGNEGDTNDADREAHEKLLKLGYTMMGGMSISDNSNTTYYCVLKITPKLKKIMDGAYKK